jgi:hypothetical protein
MTRLMGSRFGRASLTAALVLALAAPVFAAPQRSGGHDTGRTAQPRTGPPPRLHDRGLDRDHVHRGSRVIIARPGFYDPFWRYPSYYWGYPYPYYGTPYDLYDDSFGDIRTKVTPKDAEIYVDGYYAGTADDFDGIFQRLHTEVGGHTITMRLDGYRTETQNVYVSPRSTIDVTASLEKLTPGEVSEPVAQQ